MRRPSASVLVISTVSPLAPVRMSPGRNAAPLGMFSTAGMTPITLPGAPVLAMAWKAPRTAAPPHMSYFILSMFSAGLIEMPPVSNVTALPTSAEHGTHGLRRFVGQHDHAWRVDAALGHADQQAHVLLAQLGLVEHVDLHGRAREQRLRAIGEHGRREDVGRLVGHGARDVDGLAQHRSERHRVSQRLRSSRRDDDGP